MAMTIYRCFHWQGPCALLRDRSNMADPKAAVPPLDVRGWPAKPISLHAAGFGGPDAALDWLWHQMRRLAEALSSRQWIVGDVRAEFQEARAELFGRAGACEWVLRLPDAACYMAAIVAGRQPQPGPGRHLDRSCAPFPC